LTTLKAPNVHVAIDIKNWKTASGLRETSPKISKIMAEAYLATFI